MYPERYCHSGCDIKDSNVVKTPKNPPAPANNGYVPTSPVHETPPPPPPTSAPPSMSVSDPQEQHYNPQAYDKRQKLNRSRASASDYSTGAPARNSVQTNAPYSPVTRAGVLPLAANWLVELFNALKFLLLLLAAALLENADEQGNLPIEISTPAAPPPPDPDEDPENHSFRQVTKYQIEKFLEQNALEDAHTFKEEILGEGAPIARFNIHVDTVTRQVYLVGIQNSAIIPTGYYFY